MLSSGNPTIAATNNLHNPLAGQLTAATLPIGTSFTTTALGQHALNAAAAAAAAGNVSFLCSGELPTVDSVGNLLGYRTFFNCSLSLLLTENH